MAKRYDEKGEHSFQRISKDIKSDNLGNVIFLYGVEQYLVDWSIDILVEKYINEATKSMDLDIINFEIMGFDNIVNSCETTPMFSEKKVVIIKNYRNEFKDQIIEYIKDIPEYTLLILAAETMDKGFSSGCKSYNFEPLGQSQLISFMNKRLKANKKEATRGILNMIISESGYYNNDIDYTLYNLDKDIQKIIAHSDDYEIKPSDVLAGVSSNIEHGIFKMMDAISNNKKDEAFRLLNDLILAGESEYKLLATIVSQVELMLEVKELVEDGKQLVEIQRLLKVHEFRIKKAMNFSRRYHIKSLKRTLFNAYGVDEKIKTGLLDGKLALELVIAEM
ncbi:MAG: DNA polymerase III subunit delta [Anaerovoracaceae bacterium]